MEIATPDLAFQYRVTEPVFVNAYLTHFRRSNRFRTVMYYVYPILGGILVLMAVTLAVLQTRAGEDWNGPVPLFLLGCAWLACYVWRPIYFKRLFRKDHRFRETIRVNITNGEMSVTTATAEGKYKKGVFVRALETDELILLYHSPVMFNFIPKNELTPGQLAAFEAFLDRELPVRKGANRFPAHAEA